MSIANEVKNVKKILKINFLLTLKKSFAIMNSMNIQKITADLIASGLTQQALANLVPCSQTAISMFLRATRGKRISYEIASRLQELHILRCSKNRKKLKSGGNK